MDSIVIFILQIVFLALLVGVWVCFNRRHQGWWYVVGLFLFSLSACFIGYGLHTQCEDSAIYERCDKS